MAPIVSDAQLWIALAIFGWCSALAIHKQLILVHNISKVVKSPPPPVEHVKQQIQDGTILSSSQSQSMAKYAASAIELSTLSDLMQSTSPEIRDATTKIIAERALQSSSVWRLLRRQLRSKTNLVARNQALSILVQFGPGSTYDMRMRREDSRKLEYHEFFHPTTFKACVVCLCNMLPAAREAESLRQHHHSAEADALWFAHKLLENDVALALEVGLVRKWLVNYPFNLRAPEKTKADIIGEMVTVYEYDDDYERLLCCVLYDLIRKREVEAEMLRCGIRVSVDGYQVREHRNSRHWGARHYTPSASERRLGGVFHYRSDVDDVRDHYVLPMYTEPTSFHHTGDTLEARGGFSARGPRSEDGESELNSVDEAASLLAGAQRVIRRQEESNEERALRSRRREAMVLAEGGGPIRQEDIFESRREEVTDERVVGEWQWVPDEERLAEEEEEQMLEEELDRLVEQFGNQEDRIADERADEGHRTWLEYLVALRPDGSVRR